MGEPQATTEWDEVVLQRSLSESANQLSGNVRTSTEADVALIDFIGNQCTSSEDFRYTVVNLVCAVVIV